MTDLAKALSWAIAKADEAHYKTVYPAVSMDYYHEAEGHLKTLRAFDVAKLREHVHRLHLETEEHNDRLSIQKVYGDYGCGICREIFGEKP